MAKFATYTVFISYSSSNLGFAQLLIERIERKGARCLFDRNSIPAGLRFEDMIVENIRKSQQLLILLTPEFASSTWLHKEYGIALGAEIPIVAIVDRLSADEIKKLDILDGRQTIELTNFSHYLLQLEQRIEDWHARFARIEKELPPRRGPS